jgi:hypothetical protein
MKMKLTIGQTAKVEQSIPSDWKVKKLKEILVESRLGGNYENAEAPCPR